MLADDHERTRVAGQAKVKARHIHVARFRLGQSTGHRDRRGQVLRIDRVAFAGGPIVQPHPRIVNRRRESALLLKQLGANPRRDRSVLPREVPRRILGNLRVCLGLPRVAEAGVGDYHHNAVGPLSRGTEEGVPKVATLPGDDLVDRDKVGSEPIARGRVARQDLQP